MEIKGTTTNSLSVTSGGRSGAQINREAEDRSHIINTEQVDFFLGVNNLNGDCYIIHTEILSIFNQNSLSSDKIEIFKEKWQLFKGYAMDGQQILTTEDMKIGFLTRSQADLQNIATTLGIELGEAIPEYSMRWTGFSRGGLQGLTFEQYATLQI